MDLALLKKDAKSKKTSAARLEELARHSDTSVQLAVANNPNTTASALENDPQAEVRLAVAGRFFSIPKYIIEKLTLDSDDEVRRIAKEKLKEILQDES